MKKIMFNDKYCLTQAVLNGTKTMTRRKFTLTLDKDVEGKLIRVYPSKVFFDNGKWLFDYDGRIYNLPKENYPRYKVGEVVAIAQSYNDIDLHDIIGYKDYGQNMYEPIYAEHSAGWNNKMFVKSEIMPRHIKITDVKVERLQDISDDDIMREGVREQIVAGNKDYYFETDKVAAGLHCTNLIFFKTPREAFAYLIDKVSGKGTWESNPYMVAYSFELVD